MSNNNRYSHSRRVICLLVITIITLCWSGISNQSRAVGEQVRPLISSRAARQPSLIPFKDKVLLYWVEGYPILTTNENYGPIPGDISGGLSRWQIRWASINLDQSEPCIPFGTININIAIASTTYHRLLIVPWKNGWLWFTPRHIYEFNKGDDIAISIFPNPGTELSKGERQFDTIPIAVLPLAFPETKVSGNKPPADSALAQWQIYRSNSKRDLKRLACCYDQRKDKLYLSGEDDQSGAIWFATSSDATHWTNPIDLATSGCYPSITAEAGKLCLLYTDAGRFSYQNLWYDDDSPASRQKVEFTPARGMLKYRTSLDDGKTWTGAKPLPGATDVISSASLWFNGSLWVVYVKYLPLTDATALFITCSKDNGKSWQQP